MVLVPAPGGASAGAGAGDCRSSPRYRFIHQAVLSPDPSIGEQEPGRLGPGPQVEVGQLDLGHGGGVEEERVVESCWGSGEEQE